MLESVPFEILLEWRRKELQGVEELDIAVLPSGAIVRVITASDNCYFFERDDARTRIVRFVFCEDRDSLPPARKVLVGMVGYLAVDCMAYVYRITGNLLFRTSPVVTISILD